MKNYYNCIYMYINKINNKKYVGQAKDFNKRHKRHKGHIRKSSDKTPIDRAFNKYGEENFEIIILKENLLSQCLLNLYECYYIEKYNCLSKDNYNIASGGHNGNPYYGKTEEEMIEIRKKMSENHADFKGEKHPNYGNHKFKGENNPMYGVYRYGSENPMYGKKQTEKQKQQQSKRAKKQCKGSGNPKAKKVKQLDVNGNLIKTWDYAKQISEELDINYGTLTSHLQHKSKKPIKNFIWRYED